MYTNRRLKNQQQQQQQRSRVLHPLWPASATTQSEPQLGLTGISLLHAEEGTGDVSAGPTYRERCCPTLDAADKDVQGSLPASATAAAATPSSSAALFLPLLSLSSPGRDKMHATTQQQKQQQVGGQEKVPQEAWVQLQTDPQQQRHIEADADQEQQQRALTAGVAAAPQPVYSKVLGRAI